MKKFESVLAGRLMEMASESFPNHGCNDLQPELFDGIDIVQREELEKEINAWNCPSGEDFIPLAHFGDSGLMGFFAYKLREEGE